MRTKIAIAMSLAALVAAPAIAQEGPTRGGPPQGQGMAPPPQPGRGPGEGRMAGPPPMPPQQGQDAGQRPQGGPGCTQADRDQSGRCVPRPR